MTNVFAEKNSIFFFFYPPYKNPKFHQYRRKWLHSQPRLIGCCPNIITTYFSDPTMVYGQGNV
jgi:hypothetical protein